MDPFGADPIFIHGIMPRSGTNFLCDLLLLHPDCARARAPIREDLFLDASDHLIAFAEAARAAWDPDWGEVGPDIVAQLHAGLGSGLVSFLWADRGRRLLTKSPSVRHLDRFFLFYPRSRLLILVRDGRSVVQSAVSTFGWDFDRACREWAAGADTIRRFQDAEAARASKWRLIRYEDLVDQTEAELRRMLEFLDLDPARYGFEAARTLPVLGSCAFGRDSGPVHWNPVEKDPSFAPTARWRCWTDAQMARFDWLAGDQLRALGYDAENRTRTAPQSIAHVVRDCRWRSVRALRWIAFRSRVRLGTVSRPLRRRLRLLREA